MLKLVSVEVEGVLVRWRSCRQVGEISRISRIGAAVMLKRRFRLRIGVIIVALPCGGLVQNVRLKAVVLMRACPWHAVL